MSLPEDWLPALQNPSVQRFIRENEHEDIFVLSLKTKDIDGVSMKLIAPQIKSRQKAKNKLPEWLSHSGIIFPPPENLEQASSEITARYKAVLLSGNRLVDLTGGSGIDTYYMSANFDRAAYIEPNAQLCELASHNFNCLNRPIQVKNTDALSYLSSQVSASAFYIDPSRRSGSERISKMQDYSPDITQVIPLIPAGVPILIKLSPMLDIHRTLQDLSSVAEVHIVAVEGEVKELLILIKKNSVSTPSITAVNLSSKRPLQSFTFDLSEESSAQATLSECSAYLYEANAAVRKSGAHKLLAQRFSLDKLGLHTHLYTSEHLVGDFPGRIFKVTHSFPYQPSKLKKQLGLAKANIQTRNFPEEVAQIRTRTRIKDGGNTYLFCYTDIHGKLRVAGGPKADLQAGNR